METSPVSVQMTLVVSLKRNVRMVFVKHGNENGLEDVGCHVFAADRVLRDTILVKTHLIEMRVSIDPQTCECCHIRR